jgi:hypothetical protein
MRGAVIRKVPEMQICNLHAIGFLLVIRGSLLYGGL